LSRVEGSRVLDLIRLIQPCHIIPVVSLMRSRVTVVFPKALGAAVGSRVMAAGSGSFFVFVYLKYLLSTEQFDLNKGCLCDVINNGQPTSGVQPRRSGVLSCRLG
jgi:hypothetical protein